jgi:hypothetical protein
MSVNIGTMYRCERASSFPEQQLWYFRRQLVHCITGPRLPSGPSGPAVRVIASVMLARGPCDSGASIRDVITNISDRWPTAARHDLLVAWINERVVVGALCVR